MADRTGMHVRQGHAIAPRPSAGIPERVPSPSAGIPERVPSRNVRLALSGAVTARGALGRTHGQRARNGLACTPTREGST